MCYCVKADCLWQVHSKGRRSRVGGLSDVKHTCFDVHSQRAGATANWCSCKSCISGQIKSVLKNAMCVCVLVTFRVCPPCFQNIKHHQTHLQSYTSAVWIQTPEMSYSFQAKASKILHEDYKSDEDVPLNGLFVDENDQCTVSLLRSAWVQPAQTSVYTDSDTCSSVMLLLMIMVKMKAITVAWPTCLWQEEESKDPNRPPSAPCKLFFKTAEAKHPDYCKYLLLL